MNKRFLLSVLLSLYSSLLFAAAETRVFNLRGDVQQLQQSITNLYGDQAKLSLANRQLAVRAEPEVLDQIGKLLGEIDTAPKLLSITLSSAPQDSGNTISTRSSKDISNLKTENGKTITLSKARLRQQPVLGSWFQVGIEEAPVDEESLVITPELTGGEVRIDIAYRIKKDSQLSSGTQTVNGKTGEWLSLFGETNNASSRQSISTRKSKTGTTSALWIKIDVSE